MGQLVKIITETQSFGNKQKCSMLCSQSSWTLQGNELEPVNKMEENSVCSK